ncbi:MAG TPA: hypothetical protein VLM80_12225 [Anaerolineales bacterium]|nr:hypothetical protein [Anaerolineales bacterium]
MNPIINKIAAVLAWIIGAMAIFAGGQVLLGKVPDYYVIDWLLIYNFVIGVVTFLFTAVMIWRNSRWARSLAIATLGVHAIVMLVLLTAYKDVVAPDSLMAMTVRNSVWVIILALLLVQRRQKSSP